MMASFDKINYRLRPNKLIQRNLVFDCVKKLQTIMNLENIVYVGMGSIWFSDFQIVHRNLGVRDMISIEGDEVGYRRAVFNQPFRTVEIKKGMTFDVIPKLFRRKELMTRPWLLWLDYDKYLLPYMVDDIRISIEGLPDDSIFMITCDARPIEYGVPIDRAKGLRKLLGEVVADSMREDAFGEENFPTTLANLVSDFMLATASPFYSRRAQSEAGGCSISF